LTQSLYFDCKLRKGLATDSVLVNDFNVTTGQTLGSCLDTLYRQFDKLQARTEAIKVDIPPSEL